MADNLTIEVFKHAETDKAILVGENPRHNHKDNVWLPKSRIEFETISVALKGITVRVEAPEWLLIDCGLDHLVEE